MRALGLAFLVLYASLLIAPLCVFKSQEKEDLRAAGENAFPVKEAVPEPPDLRRVPIRTLIAPETPERRDALRPKPKPRRKAKRKTEAPLDPKAFPSLLATAERLFGYGAVKLSVRYYQASDREEALTSAQRRWVKKRLAECRASGG